MFRLKASHATESQRRKLIAGKSSHPRRPQIPDTQGYKRFAPVP
jgi:hypothetical protein